MGDPLDLLGAHYTRLETAISILQSGKIRISSAESSLNDPAELACPKFTESPTLKWSGFDVQVHNVLSKRLNDTAKMLCLCMSHAGISSFADYTLPSAGRDKPMAWERSPHLINRMWAQYAENHRGIALCFDVRQLRNNIKKLFIEHYPAWTADWSPYVWTAPVKYVSDDEQRRSLSSPLDALPSLPVPAEDADWLAWDSWKRRMREIHYQRLYFTKTDDWQGEQELRCYWFDPPNVSATAYKEVQIASALRAIVVGERVSPLLDVVWRGAAATLGAEVRYARVINGIMFASSSRP